MPSVVSEFSNTIKSNKQMGPTTRISFATHTNATRHLYMDEAGETTTMKEPKFAELGLESKTSMFL